MKQKKSKDILSRFYDRQFFCYGREPLLGIFNSRVLLVGLEGGVGVEVAKNLLLSGVGTLFIQNEGKIVWTDASANPFVQAENVGEGRGEYLAGKLREFNPYSDVVHLKEPVQDSFLKSDVDVIIICEYSHFSLLEWNKRARATSTAFVCAETRGVFGCVFSDFGGDFVTTQSHGVKGDSSDEYVIDSISNSKPCMVTLYMRDVECLLEAGDRVLFDCVVGMTELNTGTFEVISKPKKGLGSSCYSFCIDVDTTNFGEHKKPSGHCTRVPNNSIKVIHRSLDWNMRNEPIIEPFSNGDEFRKEAMELHRMFASIHEFTTRTKRIPGPYSKEDARLIWKSYVAKYGKNEERDYKDLKVLCDSLCFTYAGKIAPTAMIIGGVATQEILKAVSRVFTPLCQFFYFNGSDVLDHGALPTEVTARPKSCRFDGQVCVFGEKFQKVLQNQRIFVGGCGGVGNELLKAFSLLGVGSIFIVDDAKVKEENIGRNCLFRLEDVEKMKTTVAAKRLHHINNTTKIECLQERILKSSKSGKSVLGEEEFWDSRFDCVMSCADDFSARSFLDAQSLFYQIPMIDIGVEKAMGFVHTAIPHVSEPYSEQRAPKKRDFVAPTVNTFLQVSEHCAVRALWLFNEFFIDNPTSAKRFIQGEVSEKSLRENNLIHAAMLCNTIFEEIVAYRPDSFDDCVRWARIQFSKCFVEKIEKLLYHYPQDHPLDRTGEKLFWQTNGRRCPKVISFSTGDELHMRFIQSAAFLRAYTFGINPPSPEDNFDFERVLKSLLISKFIPPNPQALAEEERENEEDVFLRALNNLPSSLSGEVADLEINVASLEGGNELNKLREDFIFSSANIVCSVYNIPKLRPREVRAMTEDIVPTLVCPTSVASGLAVLEYVKIAQKRSSTSKNSSKKEEGHPDSCNKYRNSALNLACPTLVRFAPKPPKVLHHGKTKFTEWDYVTVDLGRDVTLREFLRHMTTVHEVKISCISYGRALVYADFMPPGENSPEWDTKLSTLCFQMEGNPPMETQSLLDLFCSIEKENLQDEEEGFPGVKYRFRKFGKM